MHRAAAIAVSLWLGAAAAVAETGASWKILDFSDLTGWQDDDHAAAMVVFKSTCKDLDPPDWQAICALADKDIAARPFFEMFFRPVLIEDGQAPLITGYFEPELLGARTRSARFRYPVYRLPTDAPKGTTWHTRADIENTGVLANRGLELAWVEDAVGLFYMQVQGSGRIRLTDGSVMRLGYAGYNGHKYRSPGQELVRRGIYGAHQVSARVIKNWVARNPVAGRELLQTSPGYVFFRHLPGMDANAGPRGAMNRSLTAGRSLAIDPAFVPLGAPVWLEKAGADPLRRLFIAQDTGSAIKGAQRADVFVGSGEDAGRHAATLKDKGRLVVLLPIERALSAGGTK